MTTTETDQPTAAEIGKLLAELGEPVSFDEADELVKRLEAQRVADLYTMALRTSVGIKRRRSERREARRLGLPR